MGFHFKETMAGSVTPDNGPALAMEFTVTARAREWGRFLQGAPLELEGHVSVDGLASRRPLQGTLELGLPFRKQLVYSFSFEGDDNSAYDFYGQKDVSYLNMLHSMTTLYGSLYRGAELVGRSVISFDVADLPRFLLSWRPF